MFSDLEVKNPDLKTWIGLVDSRSAFLYNWVDGSLVKYTNWYTEPTDKNKPCVSVSKNNPQWLEAGCNEEENHVICKKPAGTISLIFFPHFNPFLKLLYKYNQS